MDLEKDNKFNIPEIRKLILMLKTVSLDKGKFEMVVQYKKNSNISKQER